MGAFSFKATRDGKVIHDGVYPNRWLVPGSDYLINTFFRGTPNEAPFYLGLIGDLGFTGLSDADTMASHSGWTEFSRYTNYPSGQATLRPEFLSWLENSSGYPGTGGPAGAINTRDTAGFTFGNGGSLASQFIVNSTVKLRAIFLTSGSAIGGTAGTLFATALVDSVGNELRVGDAVEIEYRHQLKTVLEEITEFIPRT